MNVKELIEKLEKYPPNEQIYAAMPRKRGGKAVYNIWGAEKGGLGVYININE